MESTFVALPFDNTRAIRLDQGPLEGISFIYDQSDGMWAVLSVVLPLDVTDPLWPTYWAYDDPDTMESITIETVNGSHHHYCREYSDPGMWFFLASCHPEGV